MSEHQTEQTQTETPVEKITLAAALNGARVHSASAPDSNTLQLVLRKGRKKHVINVKFTDVAVTAVTLKRKYISDTCESPIDFS